MTATPIVSARTARRLLLAAQGLLSDPSRRATPALVRRTIHDLGYVQVDTINVLERAHHLTLASRLDGYRPDQLDRLHAKERAVFEHWTHDASIIPIEFFPYWKIRFDRHARRGISGAWWRERFGDDPGRHLRRVLRRIEREGPLRSADFEHPIEGGRGWWDWKPDKAALEHLWRCGRLSITRREGFQKVYDLTRRVPDRPFDFWGRGKGLDEGQGDRRVGGDLGKVGVGRGLWDLSGPRWRAGMATSPGPASIPAGCDSPMAMKPRCSHRARCGAWEWPQRCGPQCAVQTGSAGAGWSTYSRSLT